MRKLNKVLVAMLIATSMSTCFGAEKTKHRLYDDVPTNHWAYESVKSLTEKGLLQGFPNGTFKGDKPMTRYNFAVVIDRMLKRYNELSENGGINSKDMKSLEGLVSEFINELEAISDDVKTLKEDVKSLEKEFAKTKGEVSEIKEKNEVLEQKVDKVAERVGNVKVSGDMLAQVFDYTESNTNVDNFQNVKVRIGFNAQPTEKVEADFKYVAYDKDLDSNGNSGNPTNITGGPSFSKYGATAGDSRVEVANIKVKNVIRDNDYFQIGRKFMTHGHALVINNYADALSYRTDINGFDINGNVIFQDVDCGQGTSKGHQIWNLNVDKELKGHNLYAGIYYQHLGKIWDPLAVLPATTSGVPATYSDTQKLIGELGSSGNITKNGKLGYDLGVVISQNERKNHKNGGKKDSAQGLLAHVAANFKANDKLSAKLAYTTADKNFDGILSLDKNQGSIDGHTTPFDDIARFQTLIGGMQDEMFANTSDLKFQLEYKLANKQYVRFAFDYVKENDDWCRTGFTQGVTKSGATGAASYGQSVNNWNAARLNKLDAKIATLEYKYQFDPSTRISVGYTTANKGDCKDTANQKLKKDDNIFWTEVYSKF